MAPRRKRLERTIAGSWGACVARGDWSNWLRQVGWRHYFRGGGE